MIYRQGQKQYWGQWRSGYRVSKPAARASFNEWDDDCDGVAALGPLMIVSYTGPPGNAEMSQWLLRPRLRNCKNIAPSRLSKLNWHFMYVGISQCPEATIGVFSEVGFSGSNPTMNLSCWNSLDMLKDTPNFNGWSPQIQSENIIWLHSWKSPINKLLLFFYDATATVRIDSKGCSLPFQYNNIEYNACISVAGIATPQCISSSGTLTNCIVIPGR